MKKNIYTLRLSLIFVLLVAFSAMFQPFAETFRERNRGILQPNGPILPYEDPTLRAVGEGGAEELEPGGGSDDDGSYIDPPQAVSIKDALWFVLLLVLSYAFYKYRINKRKKAIQFLKTAKYK